MKKLIITRLALLFFVSSILNANVIFLDDFQNGIVGSPPVGPQVGSYDQYSGDHIVTDLGGGNLVLRSIDNLDTSGFVIVCKPIVQPIKSIIEYDILIEQDLTTNLVGLNAFNQELILSPGGDNITLLWGNDHKTYLRISINGISMNPVDLEYNWSFDTFYHVVWNTNAVEDTFSLTINDSVLCDNLALGDDFSVLQRFASAWSNYSTIGNQLIDNVQIIEVLEPTTFFVPIDIKPASCPNPLNVKSKGVLPVAILGSDVLDVTTIDIASLYLAGIAPIGSGYEDVASPNIDSDECECSTDGPDGYIDLSLRFDSQEILAVLGEVEDGDVLQLLLEGVLYDGTPIEGADCVLIINK